MGHPTVTIVGAGLAGSAMAIYLGRRGYQVSVYERRADPRDEGAQPRERRSINLGLSHRGIQALTAVGVADRVLSRSVVARGRMIHTTDGKQVFQPYGSEPHHVLHSIARRDLNAALIDQAESACGVRFFFSHRCLDLDKKSAACLFRDESSGKTARAAADFVIGADGTYSTVRARMQRRERASFEQEFLDWGYKELTIPAAPDGSSQIELNALHIWPRGDCLIVSHPNLDGSHTATLFMPFEGGERSFTALGTTDEVESLFARTFPDLVPLAPELVPEFLRHPTAPLVSTRTSLWHYRDRVVLIGDGCHAVYPFYGQGMNAALEDCAVLDACLERHPGDRESAFREYQELRKKNTDALHQLVKQNFEELRDTVNSPVFRARKRVDLVLSRLFPGRWIPLYNMVVHSNMPYSEALERARRQDRIRRWSGLDLMLMVSLWVAGVCRLFPALARAARTLARTVGPGWRRSAPTLAGADSVAVQDTRR
ncbi:MAG TPA: NAD(P)/FAD-dependent oxidoreductase [Longimicrobiaceae bacterium]|nr:NAD(P)/FAD-dependent oxidoreductase [Longimicrobiaceae bacterium]